MNSNNPIFDFLYGLRQEKLISEDEYSGIIKEANLHSSWIFSSILNMEFTREEEVIPRLAEKMKLPFTHLTGEISSEILDAIPARIAHHYGFIPVALREGQVVIALANPLDLELLDEITTACLKTVSPVLAGKKAIRNAQKKFYGIGAETLEQMSQEPAPDSLTDPGGAKEIDALNDDASLIKFVNQVFMEAVKERATDIHIEPYEEELKIRYRIDGALYDAPFPTEIQHFHSAIISRIKILSGLNISEKRLPQDGRIRLIVNNKELDLRVSILPTLYGEAAGIRILSDSGLFVDLKHLGLFEHEQKILLKALSKPHGMILVTGPTGSGKTTSLYAFLNRLNSRDKKIITIEDPIEYKIPNVSQIQINPKIHLTFAAGLRSILRHDPDVLMVGEIRDRETAEVVVQSALTGHLVFSTLHTNDAPSSITRMIDIGVEHFLLASSLQCVIAQRLVRVLCPECKMEEPFKLNNSMLQDFPSDIDTLCIPKGCPRCNYTGYHGRTGIFEIIYLDDLLRDMIQNKASLNEIRRFAIQKGMTTLRQNGYLKVKEKTTSIDEVLRVTSEVF